MINFLLAILTPFLYHFFPGSVPVPVDSVHTSTVNLESGLLAYYPFNGSANDASGHNNNGFLIDGGTLTYDEHGNPAGALGCNGIGARAIVSNNGTLGIDSAFTISFIGSINRFKRNMFMSIVNNNTGTGPTFSIGTSIPNDPHLVFSVVDSKGSCGEYDAEASLTTNTPFIPQPGCYYQITAIFNRGVSRVYVNGTMIAQQSFRHTTTRVCPDAQLVIGGWWEKDPGTSLSGTIDEVRLYNRELNADEIAQLATHFRN